MLAVCGSREATPEQLASAEAVGAELGRRGCTLVCGGLGGVMEAAARGVRRGRGDAELPIVLGILPGEAAGEANDFCDLVVPSGLGLARNVLVVRAADAVILVGGGSGTLSEAALAWQLGKPVLALRGSGGWADALSDRALDDRRDDQVRGADDPTEVVQLALERLR